MNLDFVDRASATLGIRRRDMMEKDMLLHQILTDLSNDKFFADNMLFKGGTCLVNYPPLKRVGLFLLQRPRLSADAGE